MKLKPGDVCVVREFISMTANEGDIVLVRSIGADGETLWCQVAERRPQMWFAPREIKKIGELQ